MSKNYILLDCPICGNPFPKEKKHVNEAIKKGWVSTCSDECFAKLRNRDVELKCSKCGEPFFRLPSKVKDSLNFCSRKCAMQWTGEERARKNREAQN